MDVFSIHRQLIQDYISYTQSFIRIADSKIQSCVDDALEAGLLWPEPLLQLNPTFESGSSIDHLVEKNILHHECTQIFRIKSDDDLIGRTLFLHRHQEEAINHANAGKPYVLTTGTGSGKSLAYIIPAVDHVLKRGSGKGIQAIIVYPMNALANSQEEELQKFLEIGYPNDSMPVRFERYTGQESQEKRERIQQDPPDILLTNYMMLELILTRREERQIVKAASNLRFLILDELHTYRGRQGADVAMLVRRCREAFSGDNMLCVGTSATIACEGSENDVSEEVARFASKIFGTRVNSSEIVDETLQRATEPFDLDSADAINSLRNEVLQNNPSFDYSELCKSPLAGWIESFFGLQLDVNTGRLIRQSPRPMRGEDGAIETLTRLLEIDTDKCELAIRNYLMAAASVTHPERGFPLFAFRLHQFISRGDTVWATLDTPKNRHLELRKQVAVPGDKDRRLFPVVFCRECGCAYYRVNRVFDDNNLARYVPRERFGPTTGTESGYLYYSQNHPWPEDSAQVIDLVPDDWKEIGTNGTVRIKSKAPLPKNVYISPDGSESSVGEGLRVAFISTPFRMCLNPDCRIAYNARQRSDRLKLNTLGVDSRSTATTILALRSVISLQEDSDLDDSARKLLSFTDNRQDASLQAGHFNDFSQIGLIRSALYTALKHADKLGLTHEAIAAHVFSSLDLPLDQYASDAEVRGPARKQTEAALRQVLSYYLYRDLERGWRVTSPNLEQCDLVRFEYDGIEGDDGVLAADDLWQASDLHSSLREASKEQRQRIIRVLLDHLRRSIAIKVDALDREWQERMVQQSRQRLLIGTPWYIEDVDSLEQSSVAWPHSRRKRDTRRDLFLSPQSSFGSFIRRPGTLHVASGARLTLDDTARIILGLLEILRKFGLVEIVRLPREQGDLGGYQLASAGIIWKAGDGTTPPVDHLRIVQAAASHPCANPYFVQFYQKYKEVGRVLEAREHTAQVDSEERQRREQLFRDAKLPILFCSPTMELGVDISQLNVVNMRNVPPTPANYAQRSGRAGRSGQPALVYTYCSGFSPHDQYYFRHPEMMVAGAVTTPRVDLLNQALIQSHIHAVWLTESKLKLGQTLCDVLIVSESDLSLPLRPEIEARLHEHAPRARARENAQRLLNRIGDELTHAPWYREGWLEDLLSRIPQSFNQACERWRSLYRSAVYQRNHQHNIIGDHSRPAEARERAKRLRAEAEAQIKILTTARGAYEGDFYSYRYFASEGFLPGYNFPRLPLSAFIPGRRGKRGRDGYLSRPRFLAISEFGPRATIYHEGIRYRVHKVSLDRDVTEGDLATSTMKRCPKCGYGHFSEGGDTNTNCDHCGSELTPDGYWQDLVRMQNVSAKRADNITCDEEERQRMGYRIETAFRFAEDTNGHFYRRDAEVWYGDMLLAKLSYGDAATIWRVNLGWRQSGPMEPNGFMLDLDRGYWASSKHDTTDKDDPMSNRKKRVVPYVEDHKNTLVFRPHNQLSSAESASLQAAMKESIQQLFQLEPSELAVLPIPDRERRNGLLMYEESEGGAGVLRQLIDDPLTLGHIAREALAICHFVPDTGEDIGVKVCGAACYDCLLDYGNQPDHELLDRYTIKPFLGQLSHSEVRPTSAGKSRADHLNDLKAKCDSKLEKRWLECLEKMCLRLPSHAQYLIESCQTRPDFFYANDKVVIFIDGPPHDNPSATASDEEINNRLLEAGYLVLRFHHKDDWVEKIKHYPDVFGGGE